MSRNRFRNASTFDLKASLKLGSVIILLLLAGLSYVFLNNRAMELSKDVDKQARVLRDLENRNRQLCDNIARVTSPLELSRRVQGFNLVSLRELEVVRMDQGPVVRVARSPLTVGGGLP